MKWFPQMRALVYLRSMSRSLERIADFTDAQRGQVPRLSRKGIPKGEIFKPSLGEWNTRHREDHPELEYLEERTDV